VNVCPAIVALPTLELVPVFAPIERVALPDPVTVGELVTVIHGVALAAVHVHPPPVETNT
jgi:hypothetical protein